jgi:hypothetical protein
MSFAIFKKNSVEPSGLRSKKYETFLRIPIVSQRRKKHVGLCPDSVNLGL